MRFVLVKPRSPGNIGSAARALKNFGFDKLVLVDPRLHDKKEPEYFERESRKMAWNALDVLEGAETFPTLEEAVAECGLVVGTDFDPQSYCKVVTPEEGAEIIAREASPAAVLFGTESYGLTREELSKCDFVIRIPTDEKYRDLNLSQSLVLIAYLVFRAEGGGAEDLKRKERPAPQVVREALANDFIDIAMETGFIRMDDSKTALELSHIIRQAGASERSAGMLRSLAKRIKAKLKKIEDDKRGRAE